MSLQPAMISTVLMLASQITTDKGVPSYQARIPRAGVNPNELSGYSSRLKNPEAS